MMSIINFSNDCNTFTRQIGLENVNWKKRSEGHYVTTKTYVKWVAESIVNTMVKKLNIADSNKFITLRDSKNTKQEKRVIITDIVKFNEAVAAVAAQRTKISGSASMDLTEICERKTQLKMSREDVRRAADLLESLSTCCDDEYKTLIAGILTKKRVPEIKPASLVFIRPQKDKYTCEMEPIYMGAFSTQQTIITDDDIAFILDTFEKNKLQSPKPSALSSHRSRTEQVEALKAETQQVNDIAEREQVKDNKEETSKKKANTCDLLKNNCTIL